MKKHNFLVCERIFFFCCFPFFSFQRTVRHICWWTHNIERDNATKDTYFFVSLISQR